MCFAKFPRAKALYLRSPPYRPLFQASPHPKGLFARSGLHDAPDPEDPESWTFFHYISFPEPRDQPHTRTQAERIMQQKELAKLYCDPFKSALEWMPDDNSTAGSYNMGILASRDTSGIIKTDVSPWLEMPRTR